MFRNRDDDDAGLGAGTGFTGAVLKIRGRTKLVCLVCEKWECCAVFSSSLSRKGVVEHGGDLC